MPAFASLGGLADSKAKKVSSDACCVAHITYVETSVLIAKEVLPLRPPEQLVLSSTEQANKPSTERERERANRNRRQTTHGSQRNGTARRETTAFFF